MKILHTFWQWIGQLGIRDSYSSELTKEIEFVNHATLLTFLVTFPSVMVVYLYFDETYPIVINHIFALNYIFVFIFNLLGLHQLAKIALFGAAILNTFVASSTFGYEGNTHFSFIIIIFATILTFDKKEIKSLIIILSIIVVCLVILVLTDFSLFLSPHISPAQQRIISWVVVYFGMVGSVVVAYFYIRKFTKQTELVEKSNLLLQAKFEELQKLNAELDRFVYSVSHDLRAPISSVLGLVYLSKRTENVTEIQQYLDLKEKSLKKLDSFIADILNYSRNHRTELNLQDVDFEQELENILELQTQYELNYRIETSLVVKQENPFFTDKQRLVIALNNLISNAFRYHNPYQKPSWIKVSVEVLPLKAVVIISDNGIGIGKEHLEKIFEMFYRATDKTTGSGLGLYIVKEVIEKLKGVIKVDSEINKGTTFTIEIPNLIAHR
jgi:signal transduction histidine kinase